MDATGRLVGWLFVLAVVYAALRGSLPAYLSLLGA